MFLIVGLGNPGKKFSLSRHNMGFMVVDELASKLKKKFDTQDSFASWLKTSIDSAKIIIAKPHTFMNESGKTIRRLLNALQLDSEDLIVIHDDLDLNTGTIRIKMGGGAGGHKGLESIVNSLADPDFIRIRVGVGRPPGKKDPSEFVLDEIKKKEFEDLAPTIDLAAQAVIDVIKHGLDFAMNIYNQNKNTDEIQKYI